MDEDGSASRHYAFDDCFQEDRPVLVMRFGPTM